MIKNIAVIDTSSNQPKTSRRSFADRFGLKRLPHDRAETEIMGGGTLRNLLSKAGQNFRAILN